MDQAFIYLRVSNVAQQDGTSLTTQEALARTYCQARGYQVMDVFTEVHTGVELWERPRLTELRARESLADTQRWCQEFAVVLEGADYAHRRQVVSALRVLVTVFPKGEEPRFTVKAVLPIKLDIDRRTSHGLAVNWQGRGQEGTIVIV